jgi:hypothetical protein
MVLFKFKFFMLAGKPDRTNYNGKHNLMFFWTCRD